MVSLSKYLISATHLPAGGTHGAASRGVSERPEPRLCCGAPLHVTGDRRGGGGSGDRRRPRPRDADTHATQMPMLRRRPRPRPRYTDTHAHATPTPTPTPTPTTQMSMLRRRPRPRPRDADAHARRIGVQTAGADGECETSREISPPRKVACNFTKLIEDLNQQLKCYLKHKILKIKPEADRGKKY